MTSFIKAMRSEEAAFLDQNPNANHLLNVIARRARRVRCDLNSLDAGESFISYKSVGLTEQKYRTAKKQLEKWALASFRTARKLTGGVTSGVTVARLLDSRVYDINSDDANATLTPVQRHANANLTSNKNDKKEKNDKNKELVTDGFNHWWNLYPSPRRTAKAKCFDKFKAGCKNLADDEIVNLINAISGDITKKVSEAEDIKFLPLTTTYLNNERWMDGQ